ncbi:MAG: ATP-dependent zinc metalloprotease FtsH [Chloroflexota bacterium]
MQFPNNNNNNRNDDNRPEGQDPNSDQGPQQPDWRKWFWPIVSILLLGWLFLQFLGLGSMGGQGGTVSYTTLLREARAGNVEQITIRGDDASGTFEGPVTTSTGQSVRNFALTLPQDQAQIQEALDEGGANVVYNSSETPTLLLLLIQWAPLILIIAFFVWTARRAQRQMGGAMGFGRTQAREYSVERPQVTFDDVAGQDAAKQELVEIVDFLKEPDKYIALGARIPRGVLLIGPPGTGKTLLARAVAGEASVSFFSIAASEFVEMFVGVGASRVRDLFKRAKDNAPSIVFIDEIDAVGRQRGAGLGGGHDEREQTLNQMLAEMDGFDQSESVIVMAATNRNDVLDPALLRPGRFDRQVTVGLPDRKGRLAILKIHTRGKPLDSSVELDSLARGTIGFSGADLANLANEAALNAARRNARKISMRDFSDAFDRIVLGTESPPLSDPHERKVVAYHEAGHAIVAALLPDADPVLKVTIVPRGQALGITAQMPDDDRRNYPKRYLEARMRVLLGGRAAEQLIFNEVTTGAENDLRRVTDLARRMVSQFGMSDALGQINFGDDDRQPFLGYSLSQGRNYSEQTAAKIDAEVSRLVNETYDATVNLLRENQDRLVTLAEELLIQEVIDQNEMLRILDIDLEDALPDEKEQPEQSRRRASMAQHFSLGLREDATDEGIINENGNEHQDDGEASDEQSDEERSHRLNRDESEQGD